MDSVGIIPTNVKPTRFIDTIDPDDPIYKQELYRPANIKEDVNLMLQKHRVSLSLNSPAFRQELEDVVKNQTHGIDYPGISTSLLSLQQISDLFSSAPAGQNIGVGLQRGNQGGTIPINDLRETTSVYSRRERLLRCKTASVYRLIDMFGWNSSLKNHITARVNRHQEQFLINPFGLLFSEITASSLIKVDIRGDIIDPGSTVLEVDQSSWMLHSAVYASRADIRCIIHIDTPSVVAVSCAKTGLLPLCHDAIILGDIAYYSPPDQQQLHWAAEQQAIGACLGSTARILFVPTQGLFALGETVEEAWHNARNAVAACNTQVLLSSLGVENLTLPSDQVKNETFEKWRTSGLGGLSGPESALAIRLKSKKQDGYSSPSEEIHSDERTGVSLIRPWRLGELEFEAMMRHLDNAGCRTGHLYRQDMISSPSQARRTFSDSEAENVTVPPCASSAGTNLSSYYDDTFLSGDETEPRPSTLRRDWSNKSCFVNTPNKYSKKLGQPKWHSERETAMRDALKNGACPPTPYHPLTPAAIPLGSTGATHKPHADQPGPAIPLSGDAKEYKELHRKVKAKYYHDLNTAGPQSCLLDGITWDEARRVRDESLAKVLGPRHAAALASVSGDGLPVAAASRAIIDSEFRPAAVIFDGLYKHQNPFEKITDEELEMYRREIELRTHPVPEHDDDEVPGDDHMAPDNLRPDSPVEQQQSQADYPVVDSPRTHTMESELSATDDTDVDKRRKKKRFKFPTFTLKKSEK